MSESKQLSFLSVSCIALRFNPSGKKEGKKMCPMKDSLSLIQCKWWHVKMCHIGTKFEWQIFEKMSDYQKHFPCLKMSSRALLWQIPKKKNHKNVKLNEFTNTSWAWFLWSIPFNSVYLTIKMKHNHKNEHVHTNE